MVRRWSPRPGLPSAAAGISGWDCCPSHNGVSGLVPIQPHTHAGRDSILPPATVKYGNWMEWEPWSSH